MFKFLFGAKDTAPLVKQETQRETVLRAQKELNEILTTLNPKARITIAPEEGTLSIELPEQMPDEAKALPSPAATEPPESDQPKGETARTDPAKSETSPP